MEEHIRVHVDEGFDRSLFCRCRGGLESTSGSATATNERREKSEEWVGENNQE
jgi:hypothetical protein